MSTLDRHRRDPAPGRGGDRRRERHRRARGGPGPLPGPQGRAARTCCAASPSCRRRSAARSARRPTRPARRSSASDRARGSRRWPARELEQQLEQDRVDVTLPGDPLPQIGRLHLITQTRREIEDVFIGLGFNVAEGPEVERVYYNFDALNLAPTHPSRLTDRHLLRRAAGGHLRSRDPAAARAHEPGAGPRDGARSRRRSTSSSRAGCTGRTPTPPTRRSSTRSRGWRSTRDITLADLKGTLLAFARAIFGPDREVRLRPHFFPFTEPSVEVDVSCFNCTAGVTADGERCPLCKGTALDRDPRRRDGRPERVRATCASTATTRSRSRASRSGWGSSGSRCSSTASRTCGCSTTTTSASWSSSSMSVPLDGCTSTARPDLDAHAARRAPGDDRHRGRAGRAPRRGGARALRRRPGARAPSSIRTPTGCSVCMVDVGGASAVADRLRRAERRRRPDGGGGPAGRGHARRHEAEAGQAARR